MWFSSPVDKLSNTALNAAEAGDYSKAEQLCQRPLREHPEALDGHERLAMLREAQGRYDEAAAAYAAALETVRTHPDDYDRNTKWLLETSRKQALARAKR